MTFAITGKKRLRELDFLRGIAILLVFTRHSYVNQYLVNIGWIGVDLFFVLSGYLVSGLLFREYKASEAINAKRFLIRRGFKIYPLFYITIFPYLVVKYLDKSQISSYLISDLFFLQNYTSGWGYLYAASWSLAVEEHFYVIIAFTLYFVCRSNWFKVSVKGSHKWFDTFTSLICIVLVFIFLLRLASNTVLLPNSDVKNFTMTHLRFDSLLAGVFLSYLHCFKKEKLHSFYKKNRYLLILIAAILIVWVPFFDPIPSFFVKTIGFSLLYVSFSIVLLGFLLEREINFYLDKVFSFVVVDIISKIGYCSYAIYIIHTFVNISYRRVEVFLGFSVNSYLDLVATSVVSCIIGYFVTLYIETYFLNVRNRYFPSEIKKNSDESVIN